MLDCYSDDYDEYIDNLRQCKIIKFFFTKQLLNVSYFDIVKLFNLSKRNLSSKLKDYRKYSRYIFNNSKIKTD